MNCLPPRLRRVRNRAGRLLSVEGFHAEEDRFRGGLRRSDRAGLTRLGVLLGVLLVGVVGLAVRTMLWHPGRHEPASPFDGNYKTATLAMQERLAGLPPAERLHHALRYVDDRRYAARFAAVDALGDLQGDDAADALERAFLDSSSLVRQRALERLHVLDRERGVRLLLAGLLDHDVWLRHTAAMQLRTLAQLDPPRVGKEVVPALVAALNDPEEVVVQMAAGALRGISGKPWVYRMRDPVATRQAVVAQWRRWWSENRASWPGDPDLASVRPIAPARADPAPSFQAVALDGRRFSLRGQEGRITLLYFWATWCSACRPALPGLTGIARRYGPRGVDVLGLATGERMGAAALREWLSNEGVGFPVALTPEPVALAFGDIEEVPVTVLIDRKGMVRYRWEGERDLSTVQAGVERVLAEQ